MRASERGRDARRRDLAGFTLVELLVVISIICLLMSVMLPSLNRAQKQGEQLHCLANQHQLSLAWLMYAGDSDDRLCSPGRHVRLLRPYTYADAVFECKTADDGRERNSPGNRSSYAIASTMGGSERDGVPAYEKLHAISGAADKLVFVDRALSSDKAYWPIVRDDGAWIWRPFALIPGLQGMTSRHGNGCNMTYADGHGELTRWTDSRTIQLIKGAIADPVEASSDNPDLDHMVHILGGNRRDLRSQDEVGSIGD